MARVQDGALTLNANILHFNAAATKLALALAENLTASFLCYFFMFLQANISKWATG